jgi:hypothetical protein
LDSDNKKKHVGTIASDIGIGILANFMTDFVKGDVWDFIKMATDKNIKKEYTADQLIVGYHFAEPFTSTGIRYHAEIFTVIIQYEITHPFVYNMTKLIWQNDFSEIESKDDYHHRANRWSMLMALIYEYIETYLESADIITRKNLEGKAGYLLENASRYWGRFPGCIPATTAEIYSEMERLSPDLRFYLKSRHNFDG